VAVPSTVGVGALGGVAVFVNDALAAVLAGVLVGIGVLALAVGTERALRERREGGRVYAERGARRRHFAARL
jgi:hypothetical protein